MQKVRDLLTFDEFSKKITDAISADIDAEIDDTFNTILPEMYFKINSNKYKIFMCIFFFLIIPIVFYIYQNNKYALIIKRGLKLEKLYEKACNQIDEIQFLSNESIPYDKDRLKIYKTDRIPDDATIVKAGSTKSFKILGKYNCIFQTGLARWVRHYGKNTTVYYKTTGYILLDDVTALKDYTFNWTNHRILFSSKSKRTKFENDKFNKEFNFIANNEIKSRVIFTPLTMERLIQQKENINLKWWNVTKDHEIILIRFEPKKWYDCEVHLNLFTKHKRDDVKDIVNQEIINALYEVYKLLGLILIPVFL